MHAFMNFVVPIPCCLFAELDEAKGMPVDSSLQGELGRNYFITCETITSGQLQTDFSTCVTKRLHFKWYMWQSRIEIEYYSVAYFECITEFDAL